MAQLLRVPVDLVVGDDITKQQAQEIATHLQDYAGVVGKDVLNRVIPETVPGSTYHVHNGKTGCTVCAQSGGDNKNADDPRGEG